MVHSLVVDHHCYIDRENQRQISDISERTYVSILPSFPSSLNYLTITKQTLKTV